MSAPLVAVGTVVEVAVRVGAGDEVRWIRGQVLDTPDPRTTVRLDSGLGEVALPSSLLRRVRVK